MVRNILRAGNLRTENGHFLPDRSVVWHWESTTGARMCCQAYQQQSAYVLEAVASAECVEDCCSALKLARFGFESQGYPCS
jgi:hypothetical protein